MKSIGKLLLQKEILEKGIHTQLKNITHSSQKGLGRSSRKIYDHVLCAKLSVDDEGTVLPRLVSVRTSRLGHIVFSAMPQ